MPIHGPRVNNTFTFYMPVLLKDTRTWLANPSIEAGDFWISKSGGTETALTNTPEVSNNYYLKYVLTSTEMNSPIVTIRCHDAYGSEWDDTGEIIFTTSAGSGSGVILEAETSIVIDSTEVANEIAPLLASYLSGILTNFTADEIKQIRYALGVDGTKVATSGGVTDSILTQVGGLSFTGDNADVIVNAFSTDAQTAFKSLVFAALTDSGNTLTELLVAPPATPTPAQVLALINMWIRNERVASASQMALKNNSGSTIATQTITDNGSSVTIGEMG